VCVTYAIQLWYDYPCFQGGAPTLFEFQGAATVRIWFPKCSSSMTSSAELTTDLTRNPLATVTQTAKPIGVLGAPLNVFIPISQWQFSRFDSVKSDEQKHPKTSKNHNFYDLVPSMVKPSMRAPCFGWPQVAPTLPHWRSVSVGWASGNALSWVSALGP
jgi:hypothetical protein